MIMIHSDPAQGNQNTVVPRAKADFSRLSAQTAQKNTFNIHLLIANLNFVMMLYNSGLYYISEEACYCAEGRRARGD